MVRRRLALAMSFLLCATAFAVGIAGPASGQVPPSDRARGLVYDGLRRSPPDGPCRGKFELASRGLVPGHSKVACTHGPDPAPDGVDPRQRREPDLLVPGAGGPLDPELAAASPGIPCYGNGSSGFRVQVLYVRASDVADRFDSFAASFVQWTAAADTVLNNSAQQTGGIRHFRFLTDAGCNLLISRVTLTPGGDDNVDTMINELRGQGFARTDRKYLAYVDANVYCGIGQIYPDDSFNPTPGVNANNGHPQAPGTIARVDNGCWGRATGLVEAHELMHGLGGVQDSAPHATGESHCTDESDRMCYVDDSGKPVSFVCAASQEHIYDCNKDDYFSTNPSPSNYLATHWNAASNAFLSRSAPDSTGPVPVGGRYNALTPARILDTRDGLGPVGPGSTLNVLVAGQGGVPATGVTAVAINVAVTLPTSVGFLTLFPAGGPLPLAANLNFTPGQTVPNLVVVKVGAAGQVAMYNSSGATHVVFDVAGWFSDSASGNDGRYQALTPARILDTRDGTGGGVRLGPGASLDVQVTGQGGVPALGAGGAVLNVAATSTTADSYLTVYPTGQSRPLAANLNFVGGDTVSNRVMAKLGSSGRVTVYNNAGSADVVVDVNGWYTDGSVAVGTGTYNALAPARILDTRNGTGGIAGPRPAGSVVDVAVTGVGGVPASGVGAVVLNATATATNGIGYLTVYPSGVGLPVVSDLNYAANDTRPNLVVVRVGAGGRVALFTSAGTHVVFDVAGWMAA